MIIETARRLDDTEKAEAGGPQDRECRDVQISEQINRRANGSPEQLLKAIGYLPGPLGILRITGQRTRSILLATEFSTSVDRLTWLTASPRLTGFNRSLSTTQWLTFTVAVTIPFIRQDPFNFNVEISVSCNLCRYQDPAGFRPRVLVNTSGSPATFGGRWRSHSNQGRWSLRNQVSQDSTRIGGTMSRSKAYLLSLSTRSSTVLPPMRTVRMLISF